MDRWLLCFIQGALFSLFLTSQPSTFYIMVCIILGLACLWLKKHDEFVAICIGALWILSQGLWYQAVWQSNGIEKARVHLSDIEGVFVINGIPTYDGQKYKFNASLRSLNGHPLERHVNVRLNWQSDTPNTVNLRDGQKWQASIKIKPAHGIANPVGFSYQRWLREKSIHATGYVKTRKAPPRLVDETSSYRQQLFTRVAQRTTNSDFHELIKALMFGYRGDLSPTQWQVLSQSSTSHLIAISGLHIGLVFGAALFSCKILLWAITAAIPKRHQNVILVHFLTTHNVHVLSILLALLVATFYAYLAGFTNPTVRALTMISLYTYFTILKLELSRTRLVLLTVSLIIIIEPMALISSSFWLSLVAVIIIFLTLWRTANWRQSISHRLINLCFEQHHSSIGIRWRRLGQKFIQGTIVLLVLQCSLTLAMLPLTALLYQQASLVGLLANLIAVPWMSLLIIPAVLLLGVIEFLLLGFDLAALEQSRVLLFIDLNLSGLWQFLTFISQYALADVAISDNVRALMLAIISLILLSYLLKRFRIALLISVMFSLKPLYHYWFISPDWQLTVLDVGQGLSIVVEKNGEVLVYDVGAKFPSGFSFAKAALIPYLTAQGHRKLTHLFLSHDDNDHNGGAEALNNTFSVEHVYVGYPVANVSYPLARYTYGCFAGQPFYWQGLKLEILSPQSVITEQDAKQRKISDNDRSCVLKISSQHHSVLLPGDISRRLEHELVQREKKRLKSDILIAPHHGSNTSSSETFIRQVAPTWAIFSTGYLNHWKMPHKRVMSRYQQQGVSLLNTATDGAIVISFGRDTPMSIDVETTRATIQPFWVTN